MARRDAGVGPAAQGQGAAGPGPNPDSVALAAMDALAASCRRSRRLLGADLEAGLRPWAAQLPMPRSCCAAHGAMRSPTSRRSRPGVASARASRALSPPGTSLPIAPRIPRQSDLPVQRRRRRRIQGGRMREAPRGPRLRLRRETPEIGRGADTEAARAAGAAARRCWADGAGSLQLTRNRTRSRCVKARTRLRARKAGPGLPCVGRQAGGLTSCISAAKAGYSHAAGAADETRPRACVAGRAPGRRGDGVTDLRRNSDH